MAVRSQDEIQNEWKRVARGLFNQLAQNSADEQAIKKVNLERKAVRQILLSLQPVNRTTELVAVRESIEPAETTTDLGIVELIRPDDVSYGRLEEAIEVLPHLLMQSKLVMLGIKQGLDVTVARDNRSKKAGNVDFTKNTIAIVHSRTLITFTMNFQQSFGLDPRRQSF
jgi:hypothetical protein